MKKSFVTVTPDNGNNNGSLSVTADANTGGARSEIITIEGGGIEDIKCYAKRWFA